MKAWKISIIFLGAVVVLGMASVPASAESEGTGDLWHWYYSETQWGWSEYTGADHPNIDITDVSYTKEGLQVTLSLTVAGTIQNVEGYNYFVYLGSPDESYYYISYLGGAGIAVWGASGITGFQQGGMIADPISADGKTLSGTITLVEDQDFEVHANTIEYSAIGNTQTSEWWQDWYPNEYFQNDVGDDGDSNGDGDAGSDADDGDAGNGDTGNGDESTPTGTPGFEVITLLAAIAAVFALFRRKK